MKKLTALSLAALFLFVSASIWEGSASVSNSLPEYGFFVATNSFPRNTVVVITNLENNRSVRATVFMGLDNPGLLVALSRDAADLIGLQARAAGRVRMEEIVDPIPFPELLGALPEDSASTEVPPSTEEYLTEAPENAVESSVFLSEAPTYIPDVPAEAMDLADSRNFAGTSDPVDPISPVERADLGAPPSHITSPEAYDFALFESEQRPPSGPAVYIDPEDVIASINPRPASPPREVIINPEDIIAPISPPPPREAVINPRDIIDPVNPPAPTREAAINPGDIIASVSPPPPREAAINPGDIIGPVNPPAPTREATINPQDIIAPVGPQPPPYVGPVDIVSSGPYTAPPREVTIDPRDIIAPVGPQPPPHVAPVDLISAAPPHAAPPREVTIAPENVIAPVRPQARAAETAPRHPSDLSFSAPLISGLEKGMYYVQLAALSKPESIETEIARIGRSWPLAVQRAGTAEDPIFRLLVGPLNLGESGAILQRFRATYRDAFVRVGN